MSAKHGFDGWDPLLCWRCLRSTGRVFYVVSSALPAGTQRETGVGQTGLSPYGALSLRGSLFTGLSPYGTLSLRGSLLVMENTSTNVHILSSIPSVIYYIIFIIFIHSKHKRLN